MEITFRPLGAWPGKETPQRERKNGRFEATYSETLILLDRELKFLSAKQVVIQLALRECDIRLDGMPRVNSRPEHSGVILSFESKHGPLSYPCDTFVLWESNVRAIALSLEHLRAVDRYGVTKRGEQYKGWQGLPAPATLVDVAKDLLQTESGRIIRSKNDLDEVYKIAAVKNHPDRGGTADKFIKIKDARDLLAIHLPN